MSVLRLVAWTCVLLMSGVGGGARAAETAQPLRVVATTSLIETAVRDLLGDRCDVLRLLPAGSCPGHFDIEPAHIKALSSADAFIRHDFQAGLDRSASRGGVTPQRTIEVTSLPAFTIPSNYVAMCRELADKLAAIRPDLEDALSARLGEIEAQAVEVEARVRARGAKLRGRRVLAASYQRDFCEWAGLVVVAVFQAGTDESAWLLNRAVDMAKTGRAEAVVGNQQWGPKHLEALREATGLPGVMLSNFPASGQAGAYWQLVEGNLSALEGLWYGRGD